MTGPGYEAEDGATRSEEKFLDPANLENERLAYLHRLEEGLEKGDGAELARVTAELSPGDLSEVLRPLSVEDTARVLRVLPPDALAEVLAEIDNRSLTALFTLLDVDEIADLLEEMPSDEATDIIGELDQRQAQEILAAMEEEERGEVTELLQYSPDTAGGLMGKEYASLSADAHARDAVRLLRSLSEEDLEELHYIFLVDGEGRLVGRIPLVKLLRAEDETPLREIMEPDLLYVDVDLDQEDVAQFFMDHDLISLPVVDRKGRMVGRITADDILDVMEEEATEDLSRLAGLSVEEFGEQSPVRIARSRLPWLLGGVLGEIGSVFVLSRFEVSLQSKVALAFFIPVIMATAGNTGIQTSSVVVRGLATGELDLIRMGRHILRELRTAMVTGCVVASVLFLISYAFEADAHLSMVLALAMMLVVLFAALVGSSIPLILNRFGADPAVATGPFITTANDICGLLIYLGLAALLLGLDIGG